ncbi:MAG: UDP-4-amino-4,6-dideoxy-N-acetyl-beta-L-altrosamine transaminase [Alteromonadales bacterium]|nr:UDP-4-amino-4,6-dideoxy-N-acetyl-beta-L-altrosamine transaminase [Alteromonadales bacterium]MCP4989669.1 UDP-4-amino-4,6-dideoxy-N-acetyl-beta-L-altrosamine transaminase [Colwellia sp.]
MIPYGKQKISQEDIDSVIEVLSSDYLTQGPKVPKFEEEIAQYCQSSYACAVNSATSALHIACLALEVDKGDIVWTSPISFVASANCALYCGATVDFVDIDISSGNLCATALKHKLAQAKKSNTLPKVIIAVHLAGQSCDMKAIKALADIYHFSIIEDASHAIGARYLDAPVGNCQYSDITVFSFHPVKIITTAEGGMALTNSAALIEKLRLYRSHGVTADKSLMIGESDGPWYYQQIALGFNYRMSELQAALGTSQLTKLDSFVQQRNNIAKTYDKAFSATKLSPLFPAKNTYSSYHLYIVLLDSADIDQHESIITTLRGKNIFAHVHYIPIHTQPYYQGLGFSVGDFPAAENYYQRAISLPLYPELSSDEQQYIIDTIIELI